MEVNKQLHDPVVRKVFVSDPILPSWSVSRTREIKVGAQVWRHLAISKRRTQHLKAILEQMDLVHLAIEITSLSTHVRALTQTVATRRGLREFDEGSSRPFGEAG